MRRFVRSIDGVSIWSGKVFSYLFLAAMLIIVYDVISRGIFGLTNVWAFDAGIYCCGIAWVVGGAYVLYRGRHVKVDVVSAQLPSRVQAFLDLIFNLPSFAIYCGVLVWVGGYRAWEALQINETLPTTWDPVIWPLRCAIPLGGLLILLQGLAKAVRDMYMVIKRERLD